MQAVDQPIEPARHDHRQRSAQSHREPADVDPRTYYRRDVSALGVVG